MDREEKNQAVEALLQLKSHYSKEYNYHLNKALEAKKHQERIEEMLKDLLFEEETLLQEKKEDDKEQILMLSGIKERKSNNTEIGEVLKEEEEESSPKPVEPIKNVTEEFSKGISVLKVITKLDKGKTLHFNYLQKILEQTLKRRLNKEEAEQYIKEGISRGYLEKEEHNENCYVATSRTKENSTESEAEKSETQKQKDSQNLVNSQSKGQKKKHNLPSSGKLKETMLETIKNYISRCKPKQFRAKDVINYLYSQNSQQKWTKERKTKVNQAIANVLGRKAYIGSQWQKIRPGVYQPLK